MLTALPHLQVYISAIEGHVPDDFIWCFARYLDFCYLARQSAHDSTSLASMQEALNQFHRYHAAFKTAGVRSDGFSLPWQHTLQHYITGIRLFGSPNGVCTSITESKHIRAVKKPWCASSKNNLLPQILRTNQCLDKLSAARSVFTSCHMLDGNILADALGLDPEFMADNDMEDTADEAEDEVKGVEGEAEGVVELPQ